MSPDNDDNEYFDLDQDVDEEFGGGDDDREYPDDWYDLLNDGAYEVYDVDVAVAYGVSE